MSKEGRKIIASILATAAITAGAMGCNKDKSPEIPVDDTKIIPQTQTITTATEITQATPTKISEVEIKLDTSSSYPNTLTCESVSKLTDSIMLELQDLHDGSSKIVSENVNKEVLMGIFMCESSYKINPDTGDEYGDSFTGIGQINTMAITDSLNRIHTVYHNQSKERQSELQDNFYV